MRTGFIIGIIAGTFALAVSFTSKILFVTPFLPEIGALALFSNVPGELESQAIESLGILAKYSAFGGAILVNLLLFGLLGVIYERASSTIMRGGSLKRFIRYSILIYIFLSAFGFWLSIISSISSNPISISSVLVSTIPVAVSFSLITVVIHSKWEIANSIQTAETTNMETEETTTIRPEDTPPTPIAQPHLQRRLLIRGSLLSASAVGAALLIYGLLPFTSSSPFGESTSTRSNRPITPASDLTGIFKDPRLTEFVNSEITSNKEFYKVQVNIFDPVVDVNKWSLKINGLVDREIEMTYDEILSLPSKEQFTTLECISNEIGGNLIGNALWKGTTLKEVLDRAGVKEDSFYIKFKSFDGYWVGIPLDKAMMESTLLAYQMNGETLSAGHGFPLRAIVPGIYGMMNAKWITEIQLEPAVVVGFWQERGWSNDAQIMTNVIIKKPRSGARFSGPTPLSGVAFAGVRGISKVEVSMDRGETWTEASLKRPLSGYSWVLWALEWIPPSAGVYQIWARATDSTGTTQIEKTTQPFPNGATGYHKINVRVQGV